jgi:hypothetical protein
MILTTQTSMIGRAEALYFGHILVIIIGELPLGRARFASRGGGATEDIGFPRGGVVPPRDLRGLSRGGSG